MISLMTMVYSKWYLALQILQWPHFGPSFLCWAGWWSTRFGGILCSFVIMDRWLPGGATGTLNFCRDGGPIKMVHTRRLMDPNGGLDTITLKHSLSWSGAKLVPWFMRELAVIKWMVQWQWWKNQSKSEWTGIQLIWTSLPCQWLQSLSHPAQFYAVRDPI